MSSAGTGILALQLGCENMGRLFGRTQRKICVLGFLWIFNNFQRYVGNSTQKRGLNKPKGLGRQKYERPGHWLKEGTTLEKGLCLGAYLSLYLHQDTLMGWNKNESSYTLTTLPIAFGWGSLFLVVGDHHCGKVPEAEIWFFNQPKGKMKLPTYQLTTVKCGLGSMSKVGNDKWVSSSL